MGDNMYDLIIIGLGPAGFSAALYASRAGLDTLVIEKGAPGGTLNTIKEVENYLGYEKIMGPDLAMEFYKQFKNTNIPLVNEEVIDIKEEVLSKTVYTNENKYETKAVIIATGRGQKKLRVGHNVKGVSYCALCDANLYKNKTVGLVGNNPKAIEETIYMSDIVEKIYLVINSDTINASEDNIKLLDKKNIEIIYNEEVIDVLEEDDKITGIILNNQDLKVDGLFVNLGFGPSTYFSEALHITNEQGYITINDKCETKVKGIYAAGDNVKKDIYQIINAGSEGAVAAINANKYIKGIQ